MKTDARCYRITFGASHTVDYEVSIIERLTTFGIAVAPIGVNDAATLPSPAGFPMPGAASSVPAAVVTNRPGVPFDGANVKPAKSGNGFVAWDRDLRTSWMFNDDARALSDGTSGTRVWKARLYGNKWVGIAERATLIAASQDSRKG